MGTDELIVVETLGDGAVQVQEARAVPAGVVSLELGVGSVTINPAFPGGPPSCIVASPGPAYEDLRELYGVSVARLAQRLGAYREPGIRDVAPYRPADVGDVHALARLGTVRWLQAWSPLPLDQRLLRMEELTLVEALRHRLDGESESVQELAELCRYVVEAHARDGVEFHPVSSLLQEALVQVSAHAPAWSGLGEWAQAELRRWNVRGRRGDSRLDPEVHRALRVPLALAAGSTVFAGEDTVDWEDVPRGWVSAAENNAFWRIELSAEHLEVSVSVAGAEPVRWFGGFAWGRQPSAEDSLPFNLLIGSRKTPLLTGELRFSSTANSWRGAAHGGSFHAGMVRHQIDSGEPLAVDVGEASPGARIAAEARRWCVRGLGAYRLLTAVEDETLRATAVEVLRRSAECWHQAGYEPEEQVNGELAGRVELGERPAGVVLTVAEQWLLDHGLT